MVKVLKSSFSPSPLYQFSSLFQTVHGTNQKDALCYIFKNILRLHLHVQHEENARPSMPCTKKEKKGLFLVFFVNMSVLQIV